MGAGLTECYNSILKASLKIDSRSLQGWMKRLHETLWDLNNRPRDGKPSALKMLQMTWYSLLRIQIAGVTTRYHPRLAMKITFCSLSLRKYRTQYP